jgi:hypothetical protein
MKARPKTRSTLPLGAKNALVPRITVKQFSSAIRRLPSDRPREEPGMWYLTQKEHWLRWLGEYNSRGAYGRLPGRNRDARSAYNHAVNPKMLLWLIPAAGVKPQLVRAMRRASASVKSMPRQSGAIRRQVPWNIVAAALWGTKTVSSSKKRGLKRR